MMAKRLFITLFFLLIFLSFAANVRAQETAKIYLFYGTGCTHCAVVDDYLTGNNFYETYSIDKREIYSNRLNAVLFNQIMSDLGIPEMKRGVPAMVIGDTVLVGDTPIIDGFKTQADDFIAANNQAKPSITPTVNSTPTPHISTLPAVDQNVNQSSKQDGDITLLLVLAASLVDAINPCAFAVLVILMTTILASGNNKKALKAGLAFAGSIFISYFLMGLGLYKALGVSGLSSIFIKIVGSLAIILGLFNLKDWLWYGKGFLLEVPQSWRPKMKSLIKSVTSPIGAFLVGFIVSLFLLPCTSGPYIVVLGMLAEKQTYAKALFYLVIYNLVFITPMVLITWLVYKGLDPKKVEKMRQRNLRTLHLIAGIVLIGMGLAILKGWF